MGNWNNFKKIDSHIHILPSAVVKANKEIEDSFIQAGDIDEYVKLMDKFNIDKAIIMPFNDPFLMSMEFNISSVHNNLINMKEKYPDRFFIFADIDVRNTIEVTLNELERIFKTKQFSGIKIHPTNVNMPVDCDYFDKVFSFAEVNQIPVEIHSYPDTNNTNDVCSAKRILNVIKNHPKLRISIAHLSGFQYKEIVNCDVWVNISAILPDLVNKFGINETNRILRLFNIDRLIFGTDYPSSRMLNYKDIYNTYFDILNQMDFTDDEIEKISYKNSLIFLEVSI